MKKTVNKNQSLFEFLLELYPDSPRTRVKKLLQAGVSVNSRNVTGHSFMLRPGDEVEIKKVARQANEPDPPFPILYEDKDVIVVDKPAGIATSSIDGSRNIRDELSSYLRDRSKGTQRAWVVHRLDKEVSGVLLFAKSEKYADQIRERWDESEKHYYALVEGVPGKPEGTVRSWLIEDSKQKVHSTTNNGRAKLAITDYKVIKTLEKYSLLDITTHTGRKNQIRVHMSDLGCPIVGDRKYGASDDYVRRVRLHAYFLSFPHPTHGKAVTVQSELPAMFLTVKEGDEKYK